MNKTEISKNYNIDKIVTAKELASLSRVYKDNLETIIVIMKRKETNNKTTKQLLIEFIQKQTKFNKIVESFIVQQENFNNIVIKQFKQHGWMD